MDIINTFIAERCIEDPAAEISKSDLYTAYGKWCEDYGERIISKKEFGGRLNRRGIEGTKTKGVRCWIGIKCRPEDDN